MPEIRDFLDNVHVELSPAWFRRCRPRILIVVDGNLSFSDTAGFGLGRFVQAIAGASPSPILTLADRDNLGPPGSQLNPVTIHGTNYQFWDAFKFDTANPAVTIANYDQIWMFGFAVANSPLTDPEVRTIADFMNAGGGVFSTGDHASLGAGMGNRLPRVRHMREWAAIPMGSEPNDSARDRIDTVVNPGTNNLYEFDDQADSLPQRIYPNYAVTWSGPVWTATLHPVLRLSGAPEFRTNNSGFTQDMDVLPDHPHESVCYTVSATEKATAFNGNYTLVQRNFQEFPNAASGVGRIGSEILAFAVSGGRSVMNGVWKPPVRPRMFGIAAAFDGHAAASYVANGPRPGRIVVDATWHHYVNVNLDGRGTFPVRQGLGSWTGNVFTPSSDLLKIYQYYRNILTWLQPANRIWCWWWWHLLAIRLSPALLEELEELKVRDDIQFNEGLGREVVRQIELARGPGSARDLVQAALRQAPETAALADRPEALALIEDGGANLGLAYILGKAVAGLYAALPSDALADLDARLAGKKHEAIEAESARTIAAAAFEAAALQAERGEERLRLLKALPKAAAKAASKA